MKDGMTNWRQRSGAKSTGAFTLVELLAVVLIIAVLAGLTIGVAKYVMTRMKVAQTKAQLAALGTAIENFHIDNGYYPISIDKKAAEFLSDLETNSWLLYSQLTNPKKYIQFTSGQIVTEKGGVPYIVDAWGTPIVYYNPTNAWTAETMQTGVISNLSVGKVTGGQVTWKYSVGGKRNAVSYDLFSYGPDKITYISGGSGPWSSVTAAADDIANYKP